MTDIQQILTDFFAWGKDGQLKTSCTSPSLMLMRSAPKLDDSVAPSTSKVTAHYMSDADAAIVDKQLGKLKERYEEQFNIVCLKYGRNYNYSDIAKALKISKDRVGKELRAGEGFIAGCLDSLK